MSVFYFEAATKQTCHFLFRAKFRTNFLILFLFLKFCRQFWSSNIDEITDAVATLTDNAVTLSSWLPLGATLCSDWLVKSFFCFKCYHVTVFLSVGTFRIPSFLIMSLNAASYLEWAGHQVFVLFYFLTTLCLCRQSDQSDGSHVTCRPTCLSVC